jgi:hypothetical protein
VGVAVKVTDVPEQTVVPGLALILTEGVTGELTFIVIEVLDTPLGLAQDNALVMWQ